MRRLKRSRIIVGIVAIGVSFSALDRIEKHRAVGAANGWARTDGAALSPDDRGPQIGTSVWRIGPHVRWSANDAPGQLYVRPESTAGLGLSLGASGNRGLWIWLSDTSPASATLHGEPWACMGQISPSHDVVPVELTAQENSVLVRWGESKMVCPLPSRPDSSHTAAIQTGGAPTTLRSIGRDRRSDGVPLSPLWWMSGLMVGGVLLMLVFDALMGILGKLRPSRTAALEE
jgi:hypothetical protein